LRIGSRDFAGLAAGWLTIGRRKFRRRFGICGRRLAVFHDHRFAPRLLVPHGAASGARVAATCRLRAAKFHSNQVHFGTDPGEIGAQLWPGGGDAVAEIGAGRDQRDAERLFGRGADADIGWWRRGGGGLDGGRALRG
jgi:hypothetical protein